ncbi:endolytic transglycosylase MltG [Portibacter lacus]|uniref:Endolytic murein transglycosylase n=1 Tax=Portibacter lacus TaxID=1099794 RepID=A0AA37SVQ7_9BACT|nr:endolytic transglycosylase MltG [Portibacter lacus]GLR20155.1 aminodeoxychorismate lyase [Portibacter lacus]
MKKVLLVLLVLLLIAGGIAYYVYQSIFKENVLIGLEDRELYIPTGSTYDDVKQLLETEGIINNASSFDRVASWMKYKESDISSGKFTIKSDWNNKSLISLLRSGKQTPIKITFNNLRTKEDLAGKISSYIELDSLTLVEYFQNEETQKSYDLLPETFLTLFIPNTYEFYWNVTKEELVTRLAKEHDKFWSREERESKAQALNLSKEEIYTLASIVEKESQRNQEKPRLAGVYLNRIERGIPLQADPTVVYANGDFGLRRVLLKHLEFDSPYNTYKYAGLPPGPIYMPSIASIDAVLNREKHKYLYFCASPEIQGAHLFAETLSQHNANARRYHRWLNAQGIR